MSDTRPDIHKIEAVLDLNCQQMDTDGHPKRLANVRELVSKMGLSKLNVACNDKLVDKPAELFVNYLSDPTANKIYQRLEDLRKLENSDRMERVTLSGEWQNRTEAINNEFSIAARQQVKPPLPVQQPRPYTPSGNGLISEFIAIVTGSRKAPPETASSQRLPSLIETIVANNPVLQDSSNGDAYVPFTIRDIRQRSTTAKQK